MKNEENKVKLSAETEEPLLDNPLISLSHTDKVDVNFDMEVTGLNKETSKTGTCVYISNSPGLFGVNAKIVRNVSNSKENTSTTNQTAKQHSHNSASQVPLPECLSQLVDDSVASNIEPITIEESEK